MSTTFYAIRKPVTSLRISPSVGNAKKVTIWLNGQDAGYLLVRDDELADFIIGFRGEPLFVRSAGDKGPIFEHFFSLSSPTQQVISEYGELFRACDVLDNLRS